MTNISILADIISCEYIDLISYKNIMYDIDNLLKNKYFYVIYDHDSKRIHLYANDQYLNNIINNIIHYHTSKK